MEKVDAYVGALIEKKENALDMMGPILIRSINNRFTKTRDGDRFCAHRLRCTQEEIESFPSLTEKWRLKAHIALMGYIASLILLLVLTADKSVEDASDRNSCHTGMGKHALPLIYLAMIGAGHIRYSNLIGINIRLY